MKKKYHSAFILGLGMAQASVANDPTKIEEEKPLEERERKGNVQSQVVFGSSIYKMREDLSDSCFCLDVREEETIFWNFDKFGNITPCYIKKMEGPKTLSFYNLEAAKNLKNITVAAKNTKIVDPEEILKVPNLTLIFLENVMLEPNLSLEKALLPKPIPVHCCAQLTNLILKGNGINNIEALSFIALRNIEHLDIVEQNLSSFKPLAKVSFSNLKDLTVDSRSSPSSAFLSRVGNSLPQSKKETSARLSQDSNPFFLSKVLYRPLNRNVDQLDPNFFPRVKPDGFGSSIVYAPNRKVKEALDRAGTLGRDHWDALWNDPNQ